MRQGMFYWFAKLILGLPGHEAGRVATGQSRAVQYVYRNRYRKRRYAALRAQGKSSHAAAGALNGMTASAFRADALKRKADIAKRWGGRPDVGTRAWVNREVHKLAVKLQAI